MREPVFNETVQLGIVVRDLEATVRRYVDDYGIGPWEFARIDLGDANNYREYGRPVERFINDANFREQMQQDPQGAAERSGLPLDEEDKQSLKSMDWSGSDEELKERVSKRMAC